MLRLCIIGEGLDDEFKRQGELSELYPYLPIDTFLTKGVLLAGDTGDSAWADVNCGLDLLDARIVGGYAYQDNLIPLLPRDFSFIGVVATFNLFDFGKREHAIKGANAQAETAKIALQMTKAKVAAAVKNSHLEFERSRQLSELTRRLDSAIQLQRASYDENSAEILAEKKAKVEAETFQADLDYRQALANGRPSIHLSRRIARLVVQPLLTQEGFKAG